jgi:thiol:disulfide interchange protein
LVISSNPLMGSSQIDPGIMTALAAEEFRTRLGAVAELTLQMEEVHTVAARAARRLLQRHLQGERDYQVRRAITKALAEELQQTAKPARQAAEEKHGAEAARRVEEEKRQAETARRAEEEKRQAEAARWVEEEKRLAEAARQAAAEKQCAEAARQAEEEKRRAEVEEENWCAEMTRGSGWRRRHAKPRKRSGRRNPSGVA